MKECTDLERELLDSIIGQPDRPSHEDANKTIELMNKVRYGQDEERGDNG